MSKTLRQFQCRDDLWARVDAVAKKRGISTDDVVQAALMQLFKSKAKKEGESSVVTPAPTPAAPAAAARTLPPAGGPPKPAGAPPGLPRPPGPPSPGLGAAPGLSPTVRPTGAPPQPAAPAASPASTLGAPKPSTMAPRLPRPASAPVTAAPGMAPSLAPTPAPAPSPAPPPTSAPPPSSSSGGLAPKAAPSLPRPQTAPSNAPTRLPPPAAKPAAQQVRPLYLMFESQWYEVDKEEFVIGRGQKFSDLPIKDANISRRHCSIVRRGPDYFIKDLGSTNGVEFEGTRVDNHKIVEGSVYFLCDHELRFSFTPPSSMS